MPKELRQRLKHVPYCLEILAKNAPFMVIILKFTEQFDKYYASALRIQVASSAVEKGFWM